MSCVCARTLRSSTATARVRVVASSLRRCRIPTHASIAESGERSSCDRMARNASLASLERSASARASASAPATRSASTRAASAHSARRCSASAASRSDTSRNTRTTPISSPPASRMGAPLSSIWTSRPLRAISTVWFARPTITPSRSTRTAGLSTGSRVSALTILKTSPSDRPRASVSRQAVSASATGFMKTMSPRTSVAITASPMLRSVTRSRSSLSRRLCSAARARRRRRGQHGGRERHQQQCRDACRRG